MHRYVERFDTSTTTQRWQIDDEGASDDFRAGTSDKFDTRFAGAASSDQVIDQ